MIDHRLDSRLATLRAALAASAARLSYDEQRLAVATYRLLAQGQPVDVARAAASAYLPIGAADRMLTSWNAVYRDEANRVVGLWGLALDRMPHHLKIADRDLYAWCAWDPLFLAFILGELDVSSRDAISGDLVRYTLDINGVISNRSHREPALSFLRPDEPWGADVMETFCHYVLLFGSRTTAEQWTAQHPGTFVITLSEGLELARLHISRTFGSALPELAG